MLDETDNETFLSLCELLELRRRNDRPIVLWIGAGASRWAGVPGWAELGEDFYIQFKRTQSNFDHQTAHLALEAKNYPALFGICRRTNEALYHRLIVDRTGTSTQEHPVYNRFVKAIEKLPPCKILTTNVDCLLERHLHLPVLHSSNIPLIKDSLSKDQGFIAKLHGTASDVGSLVFTDDDYASKVANVRDTLRSVFDIAHVVFIGYGLADDYVLSQLLDCDFSNAPFGSGPHFACLPDHNDLLPACVKQIRYRPEPHKDHRTAIQVLEELAWKDYVQEFEAQAHISLKTSSISGHLIGDFYPPGTWNSSTDCSLDLESGDGPAQLRMYLGHGLSNGDVASMVSTAMHDLICSLMCFDKIYAKIETIGRIVHLLGHKVTIELLQSRALTFVNSSFEPVLTYKGNSVHDTVGELKLMMPHIDKNGKKLPFDTIAERIIRGEARMQLGRSAVEAILESAGASLVEIKGDLIESVPNCVQSLLIRPSIRKMIGMSCGTPRHSCPSWIKYPILRLAHVVQIGSICQHLKLDSAKLEFGHEVLASAAFSSPFGKELAWDAASYVIAGKFEVDTTLLAGADPTLIQAILKFRHTTEGTEFRSLIRGMLAVSAGSDVAVAINARLLQMVSPRALSSAQRAFTNLYLPKEGTALPALWHDALAGQTALHKWRQRASTEFSDQCRQLKLGLYDLCPCGSQEKVKFCCAETLGTR